MSRLMIGTVGSPAMLSGDMQRRQALMSVVRDSEIDHLFIADHISFHTGAGMDGMINAATLAAMAPETHIVIGVYLLALRHPVTVARQLSSLSLSAPGRITLGVGVGGEDRHEMEICGVDPATRGRRANDCIKVIRALMTGEPFSYDCEFFSFDNALIKPRTEPAVPIVIGGRSDAAIRRTAELGDGWLGVWCSPNRFEAVLQQVDELAADRPDKPDWSHGLQLWTGFGATRDEARAQVGRRMEEMYRMPFEKFEKYSPYGSPEIVAEFLAPYIERGARTLNVMPNAVDEQAGIEGIAEVARLLKKEFPDLV